MPLNALHHVTVKTSDLEATRDFYRDILGLEVGFRPDLDFPGGEGRVRGADEPVCGAAHLTFPTLAGWAPPSPP